MFNPVANKGNGPKYRLYRAQRLYVQI